MKIRAKYKGSGREELLFWKSGLKNIFTQDAWKEKVIPHTPFTVCWINSLEMRPTHQILNKPWPLGYSYAHYSLGTTAKYFPKYLKRVKSSKQIHEIKSKSITTGTNLVVPVRLAVTPSLVTKANGLRPLLDSGQRVRLFACRDLMAASTWGNPRHLRPATINATLSTWLASIPKYSSVPPLP